jgi:hypothetical protein
MRTIIEKTVCTIWIVTLCLTLNSCKDDEQTAPPFIASFTPVSGRPGTEVVINGGNFSQDITKVKVGFNGQEALVHSASKTQLTATVPLGAASGKIAVSVDGVNVMSQDYFTILTPGPVITAFSPISGRTGSAVTITGENFSTIPTENLVQINAVAAEVVSASRTQLTVTVPPNATTGRVTVSVFNLLATSSTDYTVSQPHTIASFAPTEGPAGTMVTITGTNFSNTLSDNQVKFNDVTADIISANPSMLTVRVPAGTTTGKITVTISGLTVTTVNDFFVVIDVPRAGLVAFYPFSGNSNDVSGSDAHLTLRVQNGAQGVPPTLDYDRYGNANGCYVLDGLAGYMSADNPPSLQIAGPFTVSGWFYSTNNTATGVNGIYHEMDMITKAYFDPNRGGNPAGGFRLKHAGTTATFYPNFFADPAMVFYTPVVDLNRWVFIAVVSNENGSVIYKNGQVVSQRSGQVLSDVRGNLTIGSYGGGFLFAGKVDDIAIYNRALSANEIDQLHRQTVTRR